jgi:hypothetical protein
VVVAFTIAPPGSEQVLIHRVLHRWVMDWLARTGAACHGAEAIELSWGKTTKACELGKKCSTFCGGCRRETCSYF